MKRRIIKQANQAYTITLPVEWVRKHKLEAGSELDLSISEKSLIISTSSEVEVKSITLNIDKWQGRNIRNHILALYAGGIDEIKINSDQDISREITAALNNVIGFALVSRENNLYIIKDLNSRYQHLDEIFKRVFQMVLLFYDSAIKDIFGEEIEELESLKLRDIEVNKFCLYLERAINKGSYQDNIKGRTLFTYSFALEKIGDEIERFWKDNIKFKPKKPEKLREMAEISKEGLSKAFDSYYRSSVTLIEDIYILREKVREDMTRIKFKDPNAVRLSRHIIKIIEDAVDLNFLNIIIKY